MTLHIESCREIDTIFNNAYRAVNSPKGLVIVLFDELDKYLARMIQVKYQNVCSKSTFSSSENIDQKDKRPEIEIPNYEQFYRNEKESFLYKLLHLIETQTEHGLVLLFCTNNFDTIFDGVNMKHFRSLRDRLIRVTFYRCDKQELIEYLQYYNRMLEGSEWYVSEEKMNDVISKLRDDLSIPYRILTHQMMIAEYNLESFVESINKWKPEEPGPETSDFQPCVSFRKSVRIPTDAEILTPKSPDQKIEGNCLVHVGYMARGDKNYMTEKYCFRYGKCNIIVYCVYCKNLAVCGCSVDFFGYIEDPSSGGFVCPKCNLNSCIHTPIGIPTKLDLKLKTDDYGNNLFDENGFAPINEQVRCKEYSFPGVTKCMRKIIDYECEVYVGCIKCKNEYTCACSLDYIGFTKNYTGNGYLCPKCS
jgi:hypothetical protein